MSSNEIEKIHLSALHQPAGNLNPFFPGKTKFPVFIGNHTQADDEIRPDPFTDGFQDPPGESKTIVQRAPPFILTLVGGRGPETVEEMTVSLNLDSIKPPGLHPFGGSAVITDDAFQIPILSLLGKRTVSRLTDRRGGKHRKPILLVPVGPSSEVGDLHHHCRPLLMNRIRQFLKPGDDFVPECVEVPESFRTVSRNHR